MDGIAQLEAPVDAVECWTPGATDLRLTIAKGIPVYNLGGEDKKEILLGIKELLERAR